MKLWGYNNNFEKKNIIIVVVVVAEQLTACGHSGRGVWVGVQTAAGQAAHSSGLLDTESFLEKRSPTSSPQTTTGETSEDVYQHVQKNKSKFPSETGDGPNWTHDVTFGGVDGIRQTLHGHPLYWYSSGYFLTIVVVAIDFLGQAKVCDTNPQVIAEPVEKDIKTQTQC